MRLKGHTLYEHIQRYYIGFTPNALPPIFWEFEASILPSGCELEQETSESGDDCHYNIVKLSEKDAKRFFKERNPSYSNFKVGLSNGEERAFEPSDI
jgi:hypothetical protein